MILTSIFGFKGLILPVIDKNDQLYFFIKNDCSYKILLNFVSVNTNKFVYIDKFSTKLVYCDVFKTDLQFKIFYMGQELFSCFGGDIDKNILLMYSDYIMKNNMDIDSVRFYVSFLDGCVVTATSKTPQPLFIKFVDKNTNKIVCEDTFISGEPYHLNKKHYMNYEISVFNLNGEQVYKYDMDLKNKTVWFKLFTKNKTEILSWLASVVSFKKHHGCKVLCSTYCNNFVSNKYPTIQFIPMESVVKNTELFAVYKINKINEIFGIEDI